MGVYRRKRVHRNNREVHRAARTRARNKDIDQIHKDLQPENLAKLSATMTVFDPDLPGGGQFLCVPCRYTHSRYHSIILILCSRHFADHDSLGKHLVSKQHKKRLKVLKELPYSLEESRAAGGEGTSQFYSAVDM